jgi:hypothetical protein
MFQTLNQKAKRSQMRQTQRIGSPPQPGINPYDQLFAA